MVTRDDGPAPRPGKLPQFILAGVAVLVVLVGGSVGVGLVLGGHPVSDQAVVVPALGVTPSAPVPSFSPGSASPSSSSLSSTSLPSASLSSGSSTPPAAGSTTSHPAGGTSTAPGNVSSSSSTSAPQTSTSTPAGGQGGSPPGSNWALSWSDEFNGSSLSSSAWQAQGTSGPTFPAITVSGGAAHLSVTADGMGVTLRGNNTYATSAAPLAFEVRATVTAAAGVSDIFNLVDISGGVPAKSVTLGAGTHTYRAEWDGHSLTWYVDGASTANGISFSPPVVGIWITASGNGTSGPGTPVVDVDYVHVFVPA